jgi:hypothetical protein
VPQLTSLIERDSKKVKSAAKKEQAEIFTGDRSLRTAYEILLGGHGNKSSIIENSPTISKGFRNDLLRYFYPYACQCLTTGNCLADSKTCHRQKCQTE